jgi:hypothetical protein
MVFRKIVTVFSDDETKLQKLVGVSPLRTVAMYTCFPLGAIHGWVPY